MSGIDFKQVERIIDAALNLPRERREEYVRASCRDNSALNDEVISLLRHDGNLDTSDLRASAAALDRHTQEQALQAAGEQFVGATFGHYRLEEHIGGGGMGDVYRAWQSAPVQRTVAIKVMRFGLDRSSSMSRFEGERAALEKMSHPNIAKIFDAGLTPGGQPYLVMELVEGLPLDLHCDRRGLDVRARLTLVAQACDAIQHAHNKNVIHRDLKPANILVTTHDGVDSVRIIDFSIAKPTGNAIDRRNVTRHGQLIGTPEYMAPEQFAATDAEIDTRLDVYALAVVLYELLTGVVPVKYALEKAATIEGLRAQRELYPLVKPSARVKEIAATLRKSGLHDDGRWLARTLRGDLDWIALKGLEIDIDRRYQTAAQLAQDIRKHLAKQPIEAAPESWRYRTSRFIARNRVLVTMSGIILAIAIPAIVGIVLQTREVIRARDRESQQAYQVAITAADASLALGDSPTALRVLANVPPVVERGWEHHYLSRAADLSAWRIDVPGGAFDLAVNREGDRLYIGTRSAASGSAGRILVCDAATGNEIDSIEAPEVVMGLAASPDGKLLASIGFGGGLCVWKLSDNSRLFMLPRNQFAVARCSFAANSDRMVACGRENGVFILNGRTGEVLKSIEASGIIDACFFNGDQQIAAISRAGLHVWNSNTGEVLRLDSLENAVPQRIAFDATTGTLAIALADGRCLLRSGSDLESRLALIAGADGPIAFTPGAAHIATGTGRGEIKAMRTDDQTPAWTLHGHSAAVVDLAMHGEHRMYSCAMDGTVRAWDVGDAPTSLIANPDAALHAGSMDRRRQHAVAHSRGGGRIINLNTHGARTLPPKSGTSASISAISPDGLHVAICDGGLLHVFSIKDGTLREGADAVEHGMHTLAFSPDSNRVAACAGDSIFVWNLRDLRIEQRFKSPSSVDVCAIAVSSSNVVAAGDMRGGVRAWHIDSGEIVFDAPAGSVVGSLAFNAGGDELAVGRHNGLIDLLDARTGRRIRTLKTGTALVHALAFAADDSRLFAGLRSGVVQVWRTDLADPLLSLRELSSPVMSLAVSDDGLLAAFANDGSIRTWDGSPRGIAGLFRDRRANEPTSDE